jgi:hypothetical protein
MERLQAGVERDTGSGEDDNDAEWYRKEVDHDPETGKHSEIETIHESSYFAWIIDILELSYVSKALYILSLV